jgi:hypothetical protein
MRSQPRHDASGPQRLRDPPCVRRRADALPCSLQLVHPIADISNRPVFPLYAVLDLPLAHCGQPQHPLAVGLHGNARQLAAALGRKVSVATRDAEARGEPLEIPSHGSAARESRQVTSGDPERHAGAKTTGVPRWLDPGARDRPRRGATTAMVGNLPAAVTGSTATPRQLRDASDRDHRCSDAELASTRLSGSSSTR